MKFSTFCSTISGDKNTQAHGGFRPGIECSRVVALLRRNEVSAARGLVVRARSRLAVR